jgi:hypothetical protein
MLDRLDPRAAERVRGEAWNKVRPQFNTIHETLVSVSPTVTSELTTIYIKYASPKMVARPFAVLWVKKSSELVLGLSLPADFHTDAIQFIETKLKYAGLTNYLKFGPGDEVPTALHELVAIAYKTAHDGIGD